VHAALAHYDTVIMRTTLQDYCNALWVVQNDNSGLPVDEKRARRYLAACLLHAR